MAKATFAKVTPELATDNEPQQDLERGYERLPLAVSFKFDCGWLVGMRESRIADWSSLLQIVCLIWDRRETLPGAV